MDCIRRKVGFCIELRDALTNQIIESGDICVYANGRLPMAKKEKKYYIFQEMQTDRIEIIIESSVYETKELVISLEEGMEEKETICIPEGIVYNTCGLWMVSIVLYPNKNYMLPSGYRWDVVSGMPQEEIRVIKDKERFSLLMADYQGGSILQFKKDTNAIGQHLRIVDKEGRNCEDFMVIEKKERFQYKINRELEKVYTMGSKIYEVYCTRADKEGRADVIVKE